MIQKQLRIELPEAVHELSVAFKAAGHQLYVVGGAVRDAVMGIEPKDIDLATDATPKQVQAIIYGMASPPETDLVGAAFGVIVARVRQVWAETERFVQYEIATFREDLSMGRHPEVRFATIAEDVQRRDLTINALFYDIESEEVVDLVGGMQDIKERAIRMVGDPKQRLAEDPLRALRAVRFAARFGFDIEPKTVEALHAVSLDDISKERIRDEFVRTLQTAHDVSQAIDMFETLDLMRKVFPIMYGHPAQHDVTSRDVPVVLAVMMDAQLNAPEVTFASIERHLRELKYTDVEVRQTSFLLRFSYTVLVNAYKLRKAFFSCGMTSEMLLHYLHDMGRDDVSEPDIAAFLRYLELKPVKGDDLMAQGYSGKALGMEMERRELELFKELVGT